MAVAIVPSATTTTKAKHIDVGKITAATVVQQAEDIAKATSKQTTDAIKKAEESAPNAIVRDIGAARKKQEDKKKRFD